MHMIESSLSSWVRFLVLFILVVSGRHITCSNRACVDILSDVFDWFSLVVIDFILIIIF